MLKSKRGKIAVGVLILFIAVTAGVLWFGSGEALAGPTQTPEGGGPGVFIARILAHIVTAIIITPAAKLLSVLMAIVLWVAQYNDFLTSQAVSIGWPVVRDVMNMFFVVVLLVIAVATILGVEEYHYSKLLGKFVLFAVLINFSKMISGLLIDISQVVMLTFVNAFRDAAAGNIENALGISGLLDFDQQVLRWAGDTGQAPSFTTILASILLAAGMLVITDIVMLVIIVVLTLRVINLWILVILSPIAYFLFVLPGSRASKYASEWWTQFINYLVVGPVLAFFLWLTFSITAGFTDQPGGKGVQMFPVPDQEAIQKNVFQTDDDTAPNFATKAGSTEQVFTFIVVIGLLMTSLGITQQLGVAGGSFAGEMAGKIKTAGLAIGKAGLGAVPLAKLAGGYALRHYRERAPGWAQPISLVKGYLHRREELHEKAKAVAEARGMSTMTRWLTFGKVREPEEERVETGFEDEYAKNYHNMEKEKKAEHMHHLWDMGGPEGKRRRRALLRVSAESGHLDDIMESEWIQREAEWYDEQGQKHNGFTTWVDKSGEKHMGSYVDANGVEHNPWKQDADGKWALSDEVEKADFYNYENLHEFLGYVLAREGEGSLDGAKRTNHQGLRTIYDLEDIGKKVGHQEYGGHNTFNAKTGKYEFNSIDRAMGKALSEFAKTTGRKLIGDAPHDWVGLRYAAAMDENGDYAKYGAINPETLRPELITEVDDGRGGRRKLRRDEASYDWKAGNLDEFHIRSIRAAFAAQGPDKIAEHSQARLHDIMMGFKPGYAGFNKKGELVWDQTDLERILDAGNIQLGLIEASYRKIGGKAESIASKEGRRFDKDTAKNKDDKGDGFKARVRLNNGKIKEINLSELYKLMDERQKSEGRYSGGADSWGKGRKVPKAPSPSSSEEKEEKKETGGAAPAPAVPTPSPAPAPAAPPAPSPAPAPALPPSPAPSAPPAPAPAAPAPAPSVGAVPSPPDYGAAVRPEVIQNITVNPAISNEIKNIQNVINNMRAPAGGGLKGMMNDPRFRKFMKTMKQGIQSLSKEQRAAMGGLAERVSLIADAIPDESGISDASVDVAVNQMSQAGVDAGEIQNIVDKFQVE